jgi:hypothetical protein
MLQAADSQQVDVIAIASGPLDSDVKGAYRRFVNTVSPLELPDALRQLFTEAT